MLASTFSYFGVELGQLMFTTTPLWALFIGQDFENVPRLHKHRHTSGLFHSIKVSPFTFNSTQRMSWIFSIFPENVPTEAPESSGIMNNHHFLLRSGLRSLQVRFFNRFFSRKQILLETFPNVCLGARFLGSTIDGYFRSAGDWKSSWATLCRQRAVRDFLLMEAAGVAREHKQRDLNWKSMVICTAAEHRRSLSKSPTINFEFRSRARIFYTRNSRAESKSDSTAEKSHERLSSSEKMNFLNSFNIHSSAFDI